VIQSLYIDPEEEITSILARVKKAQADTCVLVVPNSALILGSFINMKLLARESERIGKAIIIVTQDETGLASAQKAGLKGGRNIEEFMSENVSVEGESMAARTPHTTSQIVQQSVEQQKSYQTKAVQQSQVSQQSQAQVSQQRQKIETNNMRVVDSMSVHARRPRTLSGVKNTPISSQQEVPIRSSVSSQQARINERGSTVQPTPPRQLQQDPSTIQIQQQSKRVQQNGSVVNIPESDTSLHQKSQFQLQPRPQSQSKHNGQRSQKDLSRSNMYMSPDESRRISEGNRKVHNSNDLLDHGNAEVGNVTVSRKLKIAIGTFVILSIFIIVGVLGYVFFPEAHITAHVQKVSHAIEYDLRAESAVQAIDMKNKKLPLVIREVVCGVLAAIDSPSTETFSDITAKKIGT